MRQAQTLLNTPDITTRKGLRDRAILAVLLGCALRRSEVAALTFGHIQQRDGRWCIVDLVGKQGRVRTVPMPTWTKLAIEGWTFAVGLTGGFEMTGHPLRGRLAADAARARNYGRLGIAKMQFDAVVQSFWARRETAATPKPARYLSDQGCARIQAPGHFYK